MFALLLLISTFLEEIFETVGKKSMRTKLESVHFLGFINSLGPLVVFLISLLLGAQFMFDPQSLPTLLARIVLEIAQAHVAILAIKKADRSTYGFFGKLNLPLFLATDLLLGVILSPVQVLGVLIMTLIVFSLVQAKALSSKGIFLLAYMSVSTVATVQLYKYNIAHFNSIAAEQIIVISCLAAYFWLLVAFKDKLNPWKLMLRPLPAGQSSLKGMVILLQSYALSMGPASVVMVVMSSFSLLWSILFGRKYFHEKHLAHKLIACAGMILAFAAMFYGRQVY